MMGAEVPPSLPTTSFWMEYGTLLSPAPQLAINTYNGKNTSREESLLGAASVRRRTADQTMYSECTIIPAGQTITIKALPSTQLTAEYAGLFLRL